MTIGHFLIEKAHDVSTLINTSWFYDYDLEINTVFVDEKITPVCTVSTMITGSKTEAAPGDDDPDPDVELMY